MDDLRTPGRIVVIAPHPDDESLGCAGLLADIWQGGGAAHVICFTDGAASHPDSRTHPPHRLRETRERELEDAVQILGGRPGDVTYLRFPDGASHRVHGPGQDAMRALNDVIDRHRPACVLAPSPLDLHCDHQAAADAAREVCALRPCIQLGFYPVWSAWTAPGRRPPQPPGTRVVRRDHRWRDRKRAAIEAHASQRGLVVRDDPEGFVMPPGFETHFIRSPELFFEVLR